MAAIRDAGSGSLVCLSETSSAAQNTPVPRTSPTSGLVSARRANAGPITVAPTAAAFSTICSSSIAVIVAIIAAIASGWPE